MTYENLKRRVEKSKARGRSLPMIGLNSHEELTAISEGRTKDGLHYYQVDASQEDGRMRRELFFADGTTEVSYPKWGGGKH